MARLGVQDRLVYVVSAGNVRADAIVPPPYARDARWATVAARSGLPNVLVVENVLAERTDWPPEVGPTEDAFAMCLSSTSYRGGNIAAPGGRAQVYDNLGVVSTMAGTSVSAPQVAGAAVVAWQHDPAATSAEIAARLVQTAAPIGVPLLDPFCATQPSANVLDGHAAVLAADVGLAAMPMRTAFLDLDEDGTFDADDLEAFMDAFADPTTGLLPTFGPSDLNGDGVEGEAKAQFDLDASTEPATFETLEAELRQPSGDTVLATFDELSLTDLDILCYYAYSDLFSTADADQRDDILYEDYKDQGLTCPSVDPEVVASAEACALSTLAGAPFAVGLGFDRNRSAFPIYVTATVSGDGTIETVPPTPEPPAPFDPGTRDNPKRLSSNDASFVLYGSLTAPGGSMSITFTLEQEDLSGQRVPAGEHTVTINSKPQEDCDVLSPPPYVPPLNGGWWLRLNFDTTSSNSVQYIEDSEVFESWVAFTQDGFEFVETYNGTNQVTTYFPFPGTSLRTTVNDDRKVLSGSVQTTTTFAETNDNGIITTIGPNTYTSCTDFCFPPSNPGLLGGEPREPTCSNGQVIGYDEGVYSSSTQMTGYATTNSSMLRSCVGCTGRDTTSCSCTSDDEIICP
ncbi:MAG: S8 family serine peptidase [Myxococcota bacterium]